MTALNQSLLVRLLCCLVFLLSLGPYRTFAASFNTNIIDSGVVRIEIRLVSGVEITGTGILVNRQGYVLTNYHVIKKIVGAKGARYFVYDGSTEKSKRKLFQVIWYTKQHDIALLKVRDIDPKRHPVIFTDSENSAISKGLRVWSLGFSAASDIAGKKLLKPPIKDGVISIKRNMTLIVRGAATRMYETSAAINAGNSGGPLLDNCGFVIGMNQSRPVSTNAAGTFWSIRSVELIKVLRSNNIKFFYNKTPCQSKSVVVSTVKNKKKSEELDQNWSQWRLFTLLFGSVLILLLGFVFWMKFKVRLSHEGVSQYVRRELSRVLRYRQMNGSDSSLMNKVEGDSSGTNSKQVIVFGILLGRDKIKGLQAAIHDEAIFVGRGRDIECRIKDERVGRQHLKLGWDHDQCTFFIEDLGSVNGTWLSPEHKIEAGKPYYLQAGIEFYIADPELTLVIELPEPETVTAPTINRIDARDDSGS